MRIIFSFLLRATVYSTYGQSKERKATFENENYL